MEDIRIDIGVCTALTIDLTEFDFTGIEKVIFTIKNYASVSVPPIVEREYTTAQIYNEIISPAESLQLKAGAVYDFDIVLTNGKRFKETDNGKIILRKGVGDCINE